MKKSILEIYALAVCFTCIIAIVISLVISIYSIIEISYPEFGVNNWEYQKHQTNNNFWKENRNIKFDQNNNNTPQRPSDKELTKLRIESYSVVLKNVKRESTQALVRTSIFLIISSIFFYLHWKIFKKSQLQNKN